MCRQIGIPYQPIESSRDVRCKTAAKLAAELQFQCYDHDTNNVLRPTAVNQPALSKRKGNVLKMERAKLCVGIGLNEDATKVTIAGLLLPSGRLPPPPPH